MATVRELLRGADDLPGDSARRDAEILLCHALGQSRSWLDTWPQREVPAPAADSYRQLLAQRREGQPIAYLVGQREFWSLPLAVNQYTLIPRPETETLGGGELERDLTAQARVLDLGTGSGAIPLSVNTEAPSAPVVAVELSPSAVQGATPTPDAMGLDLSNVPGRPPPRADGARRPGAGRGSATGNARCRATTAGTRAGPGRGSGSTGWPVRDPRGRDRTCGR